MRQFRFDYSLKNIPIPSLGAYFKNLIEKVESVIKLMRWKAHFFNKKRINNNQNNHFGLASNKTPPKNHRRIKFTHSKLFGCNFRSQQRKI